MYKYYKVYECILYSREYSAGIHVVNLPLLLVLFILFGGTASETTLSDISLMGTSSGECNGIIIDSGSDVLD